MKTREPPSIGHLVRLLLEIDWFTPPPKRRSSYQDQRKWWKLCNEDVHGLSHCVEDDGPRQYGYLREVLLSNCWSEVVVWRDLLDTEVSQGRCQQCQQYNQEGKEHGDYGMENLRQNLNGGTQWTGKSEEIMKGMVRRTKSNIYFYFVNSLEPDLRRSAAISSN